jgi:hypothetical protein
MLGGILRVMLVGRGKNAYSCPCYRLHLNPMTTAFTQPMTVCCAIYTFYEDVGWINVVHDKDWWCAFTNQIPILCMIQNAASFLTK